MDRVPSTNMSAEPNLTVNELQESLRYLRNLFHIAMIGVIVLSCSFSLYLFKQISMLRRQAADMEAFVTDYETNTRPRIETFVNELTQFAKANPDFSPILNKYLQQGTPATGTPPPPAQK